MATTQIKAHDLEKAMPLLAVERDVIISKNAEVTVGFRLTLPEIFSVASEKLEGLHQTMVRALKVLPVGAVVHKQDWYYDAAYKAKFDVNADRDMTDRASERHFMERPTLRHESYLYVTLALEERKRVTSLRSTFTRVSIVPREITKPGAIDDFIEAAEQMARVLEDEGVIEVERLRSDDLVGTADRAGIIERYLSLSEASEPILRDVDLNDGLRIGERRCKLFTVSSADQLPPSITPSVAAGGYSSPQAALHMSRGNVFGLYTNAPHIYNQYIRIVESKEVIAKLERRQRRMGSLAQYARPNEVYSAEINSFLDEFASTQRQIVETHFNILVWGESDEELKNHAGIVATAFSKAGITPKDEVFSLGPLWWAGMPGNAGDLPSEEYFYSFSPQATCLLTLETNYRTSASPFGIRFVDRLSGYPVAVDLSQEPYDRGLISNFNKFILGPSGSGKSFGVNHLLHNYHKQGTHVVIVDVGGSYSGTCEYVGGVYFEYSDDDPVAFNPFLLPEGATFDIEKREALKAIVVTLWKAQDDKVSQTEYVGLSEGIILYYEAVKAAGGAIVPSFNTYYEYTRDHYLQIVKDQGVREADFDLKGMLYALKPFYKGGEFDYLLNADKQLDLLAETFIVFELDNIKDHPILFPVVTLVIMDVFITKMRKLPGDVRKIICIEEAWKAISKGEMAHFTKYLFKTARKFLAEAWVVTQEVDDILSSEIVKEAIVANADCKILMDQSKFANRFDEIAALLGLSEQDVAQILSVNNALDRTRRYKECFVGLGGNYANVYGLEVPLEEYLVYTTHKPEKKAVLERAERMGSYEGGIRALANEMRAS